MKEQVRKSSVKVNKTTVIDGAVEFSFFTIFEVHYTGKNGETIIGSRFIDRRQAEIEQQIIYDTKISDICWIVERSVYIKLYS